jgi:hypothetical protein
MNPLVWVIHLTFGCHHRHISRVFTIDKRTYKTRLDCGHEFRLPDALPPPGASIDKNARASMEAS